MIDARRGRTFAANVARRIENSERVAVLKQRRTRRRGECGPSRTQTKNMITFVAYDDLYLTEQP